jgi:Xaa-Pro dipeptidase
LGHADAEGPGAVVRETLRGRPSRLAVEKDHLSLERAEWLRETMGGKLEFGALSPVVAQARMFKDEREIALMREAARVIDECVAETVRDLRRGMTERDVAARLEALARQKGAQKMSFDTLVLSGPKSAQPHGSTGADPILENEYLLIDAGVFKDGYCSDITRTFFVGDKPSDRHREVYETVLEANKRALAKIRPGVRLGDVDLAARDHIASKNLGQHFIHRLGHGLGLEIHEQPSVTSANNDIIQAGLTFTVEPGVYIDGFGGVRVEDDIVATESGVEVLTHYPKDWDAMRLRWAS